MSEEQLSALVAKLRENAGLQEKLKRTADLDAAAELAQEGDFMISPEELQRAQTAVTEEELEGVVGGEARGCWEVSQRHSTREGMCW